MATTKPNVAGAALSNALRSLEKPPSGPGDPSKPIPPQKPGSGPGDGSKVSSGSGAGEVKPVPPQKPGSPVGKKTPPIVMTPQRRRIPLIKGY